jgi:hypothetical protein
MQDHADHCALLAGEDEFNKSVALKTASAMAQTFKGTGGWAALEEKYMKGGARVADVLDSCECCGVMQARCGRASAGQWRVLPQWRRRESSEVTLPCSALLDMACPACCSAQHADGRCGNTQVDAAIASGGEVGLSSCVLLHSSSSLVVLTARWVLSRLRLATPCNIETERASCCRAWARTRKCWRGSASCLLKSPTPCWTSPHMSVASNSQCPILVFSVVLGDCAACARPHPGR